MKFIIDNYIWFIIMGVVLLMIVIGYYAEKTEFGKKFLSKDDNIDSSSQGNIMPNNMSTDLNQGIYNLANSAVPDEKPAASQNLSIGVDKISQGGTENATTSTSTVTMDFTDDDVWKF